MNPRRTVLRQRTDGGGVAAASVLVGLAIIAGCNVSTDISAETSIGNRTVVARTSTRAFGGVTADGDGRTAEAVVGSTAFHVNARQVTWGHDHVLRLPDEWQRLEFVQSGQRVTVRIDGRAIDNVDPPGPTG